MRHLQFYISLLLAKTIRLCLRSIGRGASSLPGLVVERINPKFIAQAAQRFTGEVILVTGTNGKTTTTKVLVELLKAQGKVVLSNSSGSNLTRGIVALLATNTTLLGSLSYDYMVLEVDEAYSPVIAKTLKPNVIVLLNVMRDQLDRFGEITKTAELLAQSARYAKTLVVNADDDLIVKVTTKYKRKSHYFAASPDIKLMLSSELDFSEQHSNSGIEDKSIDVFLTTYTYDGCEDPSFDIKYRGEIISELSWGLIGVHNAFNATAAILTASVVAPDIPVSIMRSALEHMSAPIGRGETVAIDGRNFMLSLIKNPSGFTQNINSYLVSNNRFSSLAIFINDAYADGRDVSWLWDVRLDRLLAESKVKIYVGGSRKLDMALCLKYQSVEHTLLSGDTVEDQLDSLTALTSGDVIVMPTYTAMVSLREHINQKYHKGRNIW